MEEIKVIADKIFQLNPTPEECPFIEDMKLMSRFGEVGIYPHTHIISPQRPLEEIVGSKFCPGIWPVFLWGRGKTPVRLYAVNDVIRCVIYDTVVPPPLLSSGVALKPTKPVQKFSISFWETPEEGDLAVLFLWVIEPE